jgi:hypothetical protein
MDHNDNSHTNKHFNGFHMIQIVYNENNSMTLSIHTRIKRFKNQTKTSNMANQLKFKKKNG